MKFCLGRAGLLIRDEMNLNEILIKLKSGSSLAKDEKDFIYLKLSTFQSFEELEQAIRAFGLCNSSTDENICIVEKYLNFKSDIVLSGVVRVLCAQSYWGLAGNYVDKFKGFLKKDDAYELSETQIAVFSVFGEYLNAACDAELFELLYEVFVKELKEYISDSDYFHKVRLERMYHCLDYGIRGAVAELEYRVGRMMLPEDIDEDIMMKIVELIKRKK